LDVDIIREQDRMGAFDHLKNPKEVIDPGATDNKLSGSESSKASKPPKHQAYGSIDEDRRPIYPPSTTTRATGPQHSQNGSDSTGYTVNRYSVEVLPATMTVRPSMDRARPSYDRIRASMDRVRPSFEASDDFTSSARLSRIESSRTYTGRLGPRLRGLSLSKSANQ
jgi:phospholipid-translocating ATPase